MGYRRAAKVYKLTFEDPEFEGLVVRARSTSFEQFLKVAAMSEAGPSEGLAMLDESLQIFGSVLIEWNLEDEEGNQVPATAEGLASQDVDFVLAIMNAWSEAVGGVSDPLPSSSQGGGQSVEASIPMEPLSPSLVS